MKDKKVVPAYYAVIPAYVRYSNIKPNAKLLFGELTALANKHGYCFASNRYFAELYGCTKNTITAWIKELKDAEFICVKIMRDENKRIIERRIGITKKRDRATLKKTLDNNTIKNNTLNYIKDNTTSFALQFRRNKFGAQVSEFSSGIMSVDEANNFLNYWTESNPKGNKMRFEMERTFDINLRLKRWATNIKNWQPKKAAGGKVEQQLSGWKQAREIINKKFDE